MGTPGLLGAAAAVLLVLVGLLVVVLRGRADSRRQLASALAETAELRRRLDDLERAASLERARSAEAAYVITDAGEPRPEANVPDRVVLSAVVGEPLVKAVSFGHGLRRALSAESRNRIWFEMRREVRRARKQRRRDMKEAWRRTQAEERAAA